jgi:hypothetical protein
MISACVGNIKINYGKWYAPIGKTAYQCTICEFCILNGCVEKSAVYELDEINQYSCNCTNNHTHIEEYVCEDCIYDCNFIIADMGKCITCKEFTKNKYCNGCSAIFSKCIYCGIDRKATGEPISDKKIEK